MKRALLLAGLWVGVALAQDAPPAATVPPTAAAPAPAASAAPVPDPARADEWTLETEADALRARLGERAAAHDAAALKPLLDSVVKYRTAENYPLLVRAAIDAIDTVTAATADAAAGPPGPLLAAREASVAEREQNAAALRAFLDHPYPAFETKPVGSAPAGKSYFTDDQYHRVFLVPAENPGGTFHGVYAHHYAGFEPYYPDPRGLYPILSEAELAQAQELLAAIRRAEARIGELDNASSTADSARMQGRVALAGSRAGLLAEPAAADAAVLARLRGAGELDPVDAGTGPFLDQAFHDWPGSRAAQRLALDLAGRALDRADVALAGGQRDAASAETQAARSLIVRVTMPSARLAGLRQRIGASVDAEVKVQAEVAAAPVPAVTPDQREASDRKLAEAEAALRAGRLREVVPAFQEARKLWPANPQAASRLRLAEIAGGVAALLALTALLYLYSLFATWRDGIRFRRAMREQMKRKYYP